MNRKTLVTLMGCLGLVVLVVSACGASPTPAAQSDTGVGAVAQSNFATATEAPAAVGPAVGERGAAGAPDLAGGVGGGAGSGPAALPAPTMAAVPSYGSDAASGVGEASKSAAGGAPVTSGDTSSIAVPGSTGAKPPTGYTPPDQQFQQALTAGEVNDNKDFSAYLQYRTDYMRFNGAPVHDVDISERHAILVRTANGLPVLDAQVTVTDGQSRVASIMTTATGIAYFFPNATQPGTQAQSFTVTVQKDQATKSFTLTRQNQDDVWNVTLPVQPTQAPVKLDVLFLLDSTGSMGDEIAAIKDNILSISAQIDALPSHPDVHFGLVTYRDRGDQYITRISDFTPNVQEFQSVLSTVVAAGGGDEPESLNEALHQTISGQLHWRMDGDTVRLVFLVSDAPPHLDYPQDFDYAQEMIYAAARGVKIEPIAASGANDQAEYIFRQLGEYTGGQFIFLTYANTPQNNGQPGTTHHVQEGSYTSEDLDALVVKLVQDELAQLSAAPGQQ